MRLFGLTGGIGMGKSTASDFLAQQGIAVMDTDRIARQLVEPGQPAFSEVVATFGADLVDGSGHLRRDELARRVFGDTEARQKLESILHPRIRETWLKQVEQWRAEKRPLGVVVIPLLFETNAEANFNATVCVACSAVTQRERLRTRQWTDAQINQRIAAQMPIERKLHLSTYVAWSEGQVEVLNEQLRRIFKS